MFREGQRSRASHMLIAMDKSTDRNKHIPKWCFYPEECYYAENADELIAVKQHLISKNYVIIIEHEYERNKRLRGIESISVEKRISAIAQSFNLNVVHVRLNNYYDIPALNNGDAFYRIEFDKKEFADALKQGTLQMLMSALEFEFFGISFFTHGEASPYISIRVAEQSHLWAY